MQEALECRFVLLDWRLVVAMSLARATLGVLESCTRSPAINTDVATSTGFAVFFGDRVRTNLRAYSHIHAPHPLRLGLSETFHTVVDPLPVRAEL